MKYDIIDWIIVALIFLDFVAGIALVSTLHIERKYIRNMRNKFKLQEGKP